MPVRICFGTLFGSGVGGVSLAWGVGCHGPHAEVIPIITTVGAYPRRAYSVRATAQGSSHHVHSRLSALCS